MILLRRLRAPAARSPPYRSRWRFCARRARIAPWRGGLVAYLETTALAVAGSSDVSPSLPPPAPLLPLGSAEREGVRDPFLDLDAPPKPRTQAPWLTPEEFARVLEGAARPCRTLPASRRARPAGAARRWSRRDCDARSSIALDWDDLDAGRRPEPSLLVRYGKGPASRAASRSPTALARELAQPYAQHGSRRLQDPVFCGLRGGRLQPTIFAGIIRRSAERAGLEKHVTAHTLRHTAATWLRQAHRRHAPGRRVPRPRRPLDRHRYAMSPATSSRSGGGDRGAGGPDGSMQRRRGALLASPPRCVALPAT